MNYGEFFKLGNAGDFKYFTLPHFIPLIILFLAIFLLYKYQDKIRNYRNEKNIRLVLAFIMIVADMSYFWQKMYIGSDIANHLPITICGWACILGAFMLLSENRFLFDVVYFWVLAGSSNALITPAVITNSGPDHFRYYQFWIEHTSIFIAVFYMIFVHKMRPTIRSFVRSFLLMVVFALFAIYVNTKIAGANYLFLATTETGDSILNFLPSNIILRAMVMGGILFILYVLAYLPWYIKDKKTNLNLKAKMAS